MKDCCSIGNDKNVRQCKRVSDGKIFKLPRRFTRKQCAKSRGFTMRSSCAPYKDCVYGVNGLGGGGSRYYRRKNKNFHNKRKRKTQKNKMEKRKKIMIE